MTPRAHVAMYKVIWYAGGYASDVLATISLSLGIGGLPLYKEPVPMATFAGMEKGGIFVASSAGNQGPWPGTLHAGVPWLLDVPAGTIDHDCIAVVALGNGVSIIGGITLPWKLIYCRSLTIWLKPVRFQSSVKSTCLVNSTSFPEHPWHVLMRLDTRPF
ncbi:subtilisin-like protease SBT1.7 [Vitis riparia]|uniref:subtilisin-like protease SBT1.7 n=1 Tax=Vitis riparia TaxID=96939 RepID=UPI00155B1A1B|nr:subtilisin-like protease SBT1.7 [Vitis riparia]